MITTCMRCWATGFTHVVIALLCLPYAVSATIPWTPVVNPTLHRNSVTVPTKYSSIDLVPGVHDVNIPEGWSAEIFFAGTALGKPRFLAWGPDSVLFVANMGKNNILAFPDHNHDGVADTVIVATKAPQNTSSISFYRDTMYLGSETGIKRYWRTGGQGYVYDASETIVDKSGDAELLGGNHKTRTVVIDTIHNKLYLSIGSKGNADRETRRALIEEYSFNGKNAKVFATGIRNAVGLTLHPRTGRLWSNNNGSDQQGDNIPPEWVDIIRSGGFYGYPYAYHLNNWFNLNNSSYSDILPVTKQDTTLVNSMVPPAALIESHSAPMQMVFAHEGMPMEYQRGAFMALRGSWNRSPVSGSKLVYLQFDNDQDTVANFISDFCTGFLPDSNNSQSRWARPVGVALAADGSVYMTSDDGKQFILRLIPPKQTGVDDFDRNSSSMYIFPNPASSYFSIGNFQHAEISVSIVSSIGETLLSCDLLDGDERLPITSLLPGIYTVVLSSGKITSSTSLSIIR